MGFNYKIIVFKNIFIVFIYFYIDFIYFIKVLL